MRVACISDTHGRGFVIPECDVFIHAGDMTGGGTLEETSFFVDSLRGQQHKFKIALIVPGNHDACFETNEEDARKMFDKVGYVLIDQAVSVDDKVFYGSPWTPPFFDWSFMAEEDRLKRIYEGMPQELDMLITHGPPRGILDPGHDGSHVGSTALRSAIAGRQIKHHVFGHLHAAGGKSETTTHGRTYYNVAAVDEAYILRRGCKLVEI